MRHIARASVALAGCSDSAPDTGGNSAVGNDAVVQATPEPSVATPVAGVDLRPIEAADGELLRGELACSFAREGGAVPILLARANVIASERGVAVVRHPGGAELLTSQTAGGFNAMEKGGAFVGGGLRVTIARGDGLRTDDESLRHRATMTVQRGDAAGQEIPGLWTCGP